MGSFRLTAALVGWIGFGLFAVPLNPAPQDWSVQVDEATLTRNANDWAAGQPLLQTPFGMARLQNVTVELRDDQLVLRGAASAGWIQAPVQLVAGASVQNSHVQVHLHEADVNGGQVPEFVRGQLEQKLQDQLDQSLGAYHVDVRSVSVGGGMLAVSGTRQ
jgi:hypothetical protein